MKKIAIFHIVSLLLITLLLPSIASAVSVSYITGTTNKAQYQPGDTVTISGTTQMPEIIVKVLSPTNTVLFYDVVTSTNGSYSSAFTLPSIASVGTYTIVAGKDTYVVTTTFVMSLPDPTPPPAPTRQVEVTIGDDNSSTGAKVDIIRSTDGGKKIDQVVLDEKKTDEVIQKTLEQKKDITKISITDLPQDLADMMKVNVLQSSLSKLATNQIALQIETPVALVDMPKETVQALNGKELYFIVAPLRKEEQKRTAINEAVTSAVVTESLGNQAKDIQVIGNPMTIETNYTNLKTNVTFPLKDVVLPTDVKEREAYLNSLRVYVKHTDGTEELLQGQIQYANNGTPEAVTISITKFSTFTILTVPNTAPTATAVKVAGEAKVGASLTGSYTYADADRDAEGKSQYKWYRADSKDGKNKKVITGATAKTYKVTSQEEGKYISFEVTPVAATGKTTGVSVSSVAVGPVPVACKGTLGCITVKENTVVYKLTGGVLTPVKTVKAGEILPVYGKEAAVYRLGGKNLFVDASAVVPVSGKKAVKVQKNTDLFTYTGTTRKKVRTLKKGEVYPFYENRSALYHVGNGQYVKITTEMEIKK